VSFLLSYGVPGFLRDLPFPCVLRESLLYGCSSGFADTWVGDLSVLFCISGPGIIYRGFYFVSTAVRPSCSVLSPLFLTILGSFVIERWSASPLHTRPNRSSLFPRTRSPISPFACIFAIFPFGTVSSAFGSRTSFDPLVSSFSPLVRPYVSFRVTFLTERGALFTDQNPWFPSHAFVPPLCSSCPLAKPYFFPGLHTLFTILTPPHVPSSFANIKPRQPLGHHSSPSSIDRMVPSVNTSRPQVFVILSFFSLILLALFAVFLALLIHCRRLIPPASAIFFSKATTIPFLRQVT